MVGIITLLLYAHPTFCQNQQVVTFISPRSQSFNVERMLVGWENIIHQPNKKNEFYGTLAFTIEATSSFRSERISQCLFGEDVIQCAPNNTEWSDFIFISGSQTSNRIPQKDWLADYFGLPTDFKSIVRFHPRVNNFLLDAHAFLGLNTLAQGLYMRIEFPIVYANWDLNIKERIQQSGTNNYTPGYFNENGVDRAQLMSSFSEFISGCSSPDIDNLIFQPLHNAKMDIRSRRLIRCAELTTTLGHDYFIGTYHHIGCGFQVAAPCGNRPNGEFLFEPIIGNGCHWECGAELSAHFRTWTNKTEDAFTEFFFDATVTHLFKTRQRRSFDLKISPNSRYMLAEKLTPLITNNLNGNGTPARAQYAHEVAPVANITTFDIDVSMNAQADIAFMYAYTKQQNTWSIGYSLWKRGCENIQIHNCDLFDNNTWALKGDAYMFGFIAEQPTPNDLPIGTPIALSATENNASINSGTNFPPTGVSSNSVEKNIQITRAQRNPNINSAQPAFAGNNQRLVATVSNLTAINQINTSIQPHFLSMDDIDINSAATSGFAQKIFTHFNHKIHNTYAHDHYFGIGAEIEFGRQAGPTPAIGADKCINCALSYWGAWLKTGVTF